MLFFSIELRYVNLLLAKRMKTIAEIEEKLTMSNAALFFSHINKSLSNTTLIPATATHIFLRK
jgi:hypothetical protein